MYGAPRPASTSQYLESRVTTASQPELQLMLLDGALRFGNLAKTAWTDQHQSPESSRHIMRMMDVAEELVRSVSGSKTTVSTRLEEEYAFIYRSLADLYLKGTQDQLDAVLRLLAFQRQTWQLICEKFRSDLGGPKAAPSRGDYAPSAPTERLSLNA